MRLLNDRDLVQRLTGDDPIIHHVIEPKDWFSSSSPVQPCSLDLHIGSLCVPPHAKIDDDEQIHKHKKDEVILEPGGTALIETREIMNFPLDIAGIVFPPARLSSQGIMLINPGHVDPGSGGCLHACVINMGREAYPLVKDQRIMTMLLFELSKEAQRREASPFRLHTLLARLSTDFLNVTARAESIVNQADRKLGRRIRIAGVILPIVLVVLTGLTTWLMRPSEPAWKDEINRVDKQVTILKGQLEYKKLEKEVENLSGRLSDQHRELTSLREQLNESEAKPCHTRKDKTAE